MFQEVNFSVNKRNLINQVKIKKGDVSSISHRPFLLADFSQSKICDVVDMFDWNV